MSLVHYVLRLELLNFQVQTFSVLVLQTFSLKIHEHEKQFIVLNFMVLFENLIICKISSNTLDFVILTLPPSSKNVTLNQYGTELTVTNRVS